MLVTGELWPSQRTIAEEADDVEVVGVTPMEGVEHLGQYVFEMTNAKVQQLRAERGLGEDVDVLADVQEMDEGEEVALDGEVEEEATVDGFEAEEAE